MMDLLKSLLFLVIFITLNSCKKVNTEFDPSFDPDVEIARDVNMIYSDSAKLKFTIKTPLLEKETESDVLIETFPKGLLIEFYDDSKEVFSSMSAKYAQRKSKEGTMLLRDSVILTNDAGDILITPGITWDENNQRLQTSKFVQLVKSSSQDTLYGFGFDSKDDFSSFKIQNVKGKRKHASLTD